MILPETVDLSGLPPDNDMIKDFHFEQFCGFGHSFCELVVLVAGRQFTARMVMQENETVTVTEKSAL